MYQAIQSAARGSKRSLRASSTATLLAVLWCCAIPFAWSQDVPFTPRYDGIVPKRSRQRDSIPISATPTPVPIYSFKRYESELSEICDLLERDGRRERARQLAELQDVKGSACTSCRLFARQVVLSCKPAFAKKKATPTVTTTAEPTSVETTPEPTPISSGSKRPAQYPSTELIDKLSAFGTMLYERDPGNGSIITAVKSWADGLIKIPDVTPGERDYFEIVREFLLAPWQNRPERPLEPTPVPKAKIQELFE